MTDKQRIRAWYAEVLRETGWSAAHWARLAKTSPTNITRLQNDPNAAAPRTDTLQKLFRALPPALRERVPSLLFGAPARPTDLSESAANPYIAQDESAGADLPILGRGGTPAAQAKRPPSLVGVKGAYALFAREASMEPRYFEGDMVYVNPVQPPRLNDFVAIRLCDGETVIRRLIGRDERKVTVERYNPVGTEEIDRAEIADIHRILNNDELWR